MLVQQWPRRPRPCKAPQSISSSCSSSFLLILPLSPNGSVGDFGDSAQLLNSVTFHEVILAAKLCHFRFCLKTDVNSVGAPWCKTAASHRVDGAGELALQNDGLFLVVNCRTRNC